ncbi:cache domain-containing sensor histidine kinase [Paenibacillus roseipurpureus]|uniref:Histidine kinase n=1 Tax=Paenibacillus roseopurpureus TaxID=2918901 RepID=A0AA96LRW1_9BACL|nr:histidine kinase [Paenibacillus sp. MBLB1832]WNR46096.1 histidine kinase [Paenibacillus sp. MBLB1832]
MFVKLRSSLQWKLVSLISVSIFFVITSIGSFSYYKSVQAINSDVERFSNQILKQANFNLSRYIDDNEHFFQNLGASDEFIRWASVQDGNEYTILKHFKEMNDRFIDPFIAYHPETLSIVFYSELGYQNVFRNSTQSNVLTPKYDFKEEPWGKLLSLSGKPERTVSVSSSYYNREGQLEKIPVISYAQKFIIGTKIAYMVLDLSLLPTQSILNEIELGNNGSTFIIDQQGSIISAPELNLIGSSVEASILESIGNASVGSHYMEKTKQMIVYRVIPNTSWRVLAMVPYNDLARSIIHIRYWTIGMMVIGVLIASILVILVASSITSRLKDLRRTIAKTRMGRLDIRMEVKGIDEVAELGGAYNHLLDRIDVSINQLAESRLMQQRAILSALQAQMNSHFLYNALESINSMAHLAGQMDIHETTIALSNMLRYTSNYQESLVMLNEEMNHVFDYICILKTMYRDEVQFTCQIEEGIKEARCLKAIVQPFVENSIKHGYEKTGEPMSVMITAAKVDARYICIIIEDNGSGFSPDKLIELRNHLRMDKPVKDVMELKRVGVLNVHYRLRTIYHDDMSGVSISNVDTGGARITVRFPYQTKEGIIL